MKVRFSKPFIKAAKKLSGKHLESLQRAIAEVKAAHHLSEVSDCKKLRSFDHAYRLRIGGYRALFICHVEVVDGEVRFECLLPRGKVYAKEVLANLREKDV